VKSAAAHGASGGKPLGSGQRLRRPAQTRRRPAVSALQERLRFESFLVELSSAFTRARVQGVDREIELWLEKLAQFIGVERSSLWEMHEGARSVARRYFYMAPGQNPGTNHSPTEEFSWLTEQYLRGNMVIWSRMPDDIPKSAHGERAWAARIGAKSALSIPVRAGRIVCVLVFTSVARYRKWPAALVNRLRLVAEIFTGAVGRQVAQAALEETEARTRALLKALPDPMFVLSPEGVYLDCHARDAQDPLLPSEQLFGRRLDEVLPSELTNRFLAAANHAAQTGDVAELEYAIEVRGDPREYEARMVRRDDGAIVSLVRNITEERRAERRLRESEERFRGAFDHSAIGIALVSLEGRWLRVNAALCGMLGYTEAEMLATDFQALTVPDDLDANLNCVRRARAGEISHYELHKRYIRKDGTTIPALLTVSVVKDAQGQPLYFVSQIQDLTERLRAQLEVERLRLELAHFGRLALTGKLTSSLAHALSQPLTVILSNADTGQRLLASGQSASPAMRELLADIAVSCNRAAEVIHGVRGFLSKERGPQRRVDLNELVRAVADVMNSELILRQIRLEMQLSAAPAEIEADPVELQQVILNLLLNGAEAMSGKAPHERALLVSTARIANEIELGVRDYGPGTDPANMKLLFDPFFTTKPDGMGMGLAICEEIVRRHGGRLWAENNYGSGMTFHCTFPPS
jgi:two-component system sensor kinase FixL